jgi:hypothetical protein
MNWKEKEIRTVGDIVNALAKLESRDEGQAFMAGMRAESEHADANVGYCIGYIGGSDAESNARRRELQVWTSTAHPIYGLF